jgi:serine phosphatase RsbU (regulator of sigma subunit)
MNTRIKRTYISTLVEELGSLPTVAAQIVNMTSDPSCDMGQLSRVIISDNVMTMRFLALANSASVSRGQEVRNLRQALVRLGLRRVRNVALCMGMHDMMPSGTAPGVLDMKEFWKFNLATASCAQGLAWQRDDASDDDAWLVGILHNIGLGSLAMKAPMDFRRALEMARMKRIPLIDAELLTLDYHHGEMGGRMLSQWNLPQVFCEAVEFCGESYDPMEVSAEAHALVRILRDAASLVRSVGYGDSGDGHEAYSVDKAADILGLPQPVLEALLSKVDREVTDFSRLLGIDLPEGQFLATLEESRRQVVHLGIEGFTDSLARENLEEEMSMARNIQQRLLPGEVPQIPGWNLAGTNHPSLHVSGDYFDFLKLKGGKRGFVIADVSGKGMPASLLASNVQASLRALAGVMDDPGDLLGAVNEALHESTDAEKFATVFLAVLAPDGRSLRYASAGHNPPLVLRTDGSSEWLKPAGTPLGMFPGMKYPVTEVPFDEDDLIISYTDGITEAVDTHEVEFEESRLEKVARRFAGEPVDVIIEEVIAAVLLHVGSNSLDALNSLVENWEEPDETNAGDDLTMVVARSRPENG